MPSATRLRRKTVHGFGVGGVVARELVAEVVELKAEALGDEEGVVEGFGEVVEEAAHGAGGANLALGVALEEAAGLVERDVVADGGEDVEDFALVLGGVADAVGGEDGEMEGLGDAQGGLVAGFFGAVAVALQLDVDVVGAEDADELLDALAAGGFAAGGERGGEWAFVAAGEAEEAVLEFGEIVERGGAFALVGFAHFEAGDELAEVLVAGAGGAEEGDAGWVGCCGQPGGRRCGR